MKNLSATTRPMRIVSNICHLEDAIPTKRRIVHAFVDNPRGFKASLQLIRACFRSDVVIWNSDARGLLLLCAVRLLLPTLRFRLISVDLLLRKPVTFGQKVSGFLKRFLLSRVNRFILYFKDYRGYERYYGISSPRAVFVPFKVNDWETISKRAINTARGDYVLCAGRTMRDIRTFVEAMRRVDCPGILLQQKQELMASHGTNVWSGELPPNLKLVFTTESHEDYIEYISKSRMLVIPRYKDDIGPAGIATYLVAMALNRCVILSDAPGTGDILTDQAAIVPSEDPEALAMAIKRLWSEDEIRAEIAERGRKYALKLGGNKRLMGDILRVSLGVVS